MPMQSAVEREHVRAVVDGLDGLSPEAPTCLPWLVRELAELFGTQSAVYRPTPRETGWGIEEAHAAGSAITSQKLGSVLGDYLSRAPVRFGSYNPLRPESTQRNVAVRDQEQATRAAHVRQHAFGPLGVADWSQLRVLICDGPLLLAWVGVLAPAPFRPRQQRLLQEVTAPIARRLTLERALGQGAFGGSAFEAAVESNPLAVFLVSRTGTIEYANGAGAELLGRRRGPTLDTVRDAIRSPAAATAKGIDVRRLHGRGSRGAHLVTLRWQSDDVELRMSAARARWGLTRRQVEVLRLLVRGDANKDIAAKLGTSVSTIEIHVSNVLNKAKADSRTALVAAFYTTLSP